MGNEEYSKSKPISTLTVQIKTEKIHGLVEKIKNEKNYNINASDIISYSICKNISRFMEFNSNYVGGQVRFYDFINMGYFINLGKGPETVNIKEANKNTMIEFSKKIKEMALKYIHGELEKSEKEKL